MTERETKQIPGYSRYLIHDNGDIWDIKLSKMVPTSYDKRGYLRCNMRDDQGKNHVIRIHRAVALAWIPNPDNLRTVDHIDQNKLNNNVSNLRWADDKTQMHNHPGYKDGISLYGWHYYMEHCDERIRERERTRPKKQKKYIPVPKDPKIEKLAEELGVTYTQLKRRIAAGAPKAYWGLPKEDYIHAMLRRRYHINKGELDYDD